MEWTFRPAAGPGCLSGRFAVRGLPESPLSNDAHAGSSVQRAARGFGNCEPFHALMFPWAEVAAMDATTVPYASTRSRSARSATYSRPSFVDPQRALYCTVLICVRDAGRYRTAAYWLQITPSLGSEPSPGRGMKQQYGQRLVSCWRRTQLDLIPSGQYHTICFSGPTDSSLSMLCGVCEHSTMLIVSARTNSHPCCAPSGPAPSFAMQMPLQCCAPHARCKGWMQRSVAFRASRKPPAAW